MVLVELMNKYQDSIIQRSTTTIPKKTTIKYYLMNGL